MNLQENQIVEAGHPPVPEAACDAQAEQRGGCAEPVGAESTLFIKRLAIKDFLTYHELNMESQGP